MRRLVILVVMCAGLIFSACNKNDDNKKSNENTIKCEIIDSATYTPDEFEDLLFGDAENVYDAVFVEKARQQFVKDNKNLEDSLANVAGDNGFALAYTWVRYNYESVDAQNQKITLSATMAFPHWCFTTGWSFVPDVTYYLSPNNLVLDCHWTQGLNDDVTTVSISTKPSFQLTGKDVLVISPDYLGYGASQNTCHPYLNERLVAINNYDAIVAGLKILKNKYNTELEDDVWSAIIGYSQGGAVAMATAMYFTELEEKGDKNLKRWNFKKLLCGSGPYNPVLTMEKYFEKDSVYYPTVLPMTVMSMCYSYPEIMGDSYEKYFKDALNNTDIYNRIISKKNALDWNNTYMAEKMTGKKDLPIVCSSFLSEAATDKNSEEYKNLMECLEMNNLANPKYWPVLPKYKTIFFYTTDDEVVPYENTTEMQKRFDNNNKSYTDSHVSDYQHAEYGKIKFYLSHVLLEPMWSW